MPHPTETTQYKSLRFAGHCWRSMKEEVADALLWQLSHSRLGRGRPVYIYITHFRYRFHLDKTTKHYGHGSQARLLYLSLANNNHL